MRGGLYLDLTAYGPGPGRMGAGGCSERGAPTGQGGKLSWDLRGPTLALCPASPHPGATWGAVAGVRAREEGPLLCQPSPCSGPGREPPGKSLLGSDLWTTGCPIPSSRSWGYSQGALKETCTPWGKAGSKSLKLLLCRSCATALSLTDFSRKAPTTNPRPNCCLAMMLLIFYLLQAQSSCTDFCGWDLALHQLHAFECKAFFIRPEERSGPSTN